MSVNIPYSLIERIQAARKITILTGAGISKESGVPTFREAQTGLWSQYDPQALATPIAFLKDPALVWNWYAWRRELVSQAKPNPGHLALAELANQVEKLLIVTQNIDNLHWEAGNRNIIELHGNIAASKCFDCGQPEPNPPATDDPPPRCRHCNGYLRPDVVWFGETLNRDRIQAAFLASRDCDLFFSIGTSTVVTPASALPFEAAARGIYTVEINPVATPFTEHADLVLAGPAGEILPQIVKGLAS